MQLSIIIINTDTPKITRNAINSIIKTVKLVKFEILVVDNSEKESNRINIKENPVRVITKIENKGFSHACNIGAKEAKGEVLLFLNSDTILFKDTIDVAFNYFEKQVNVGALGVRQLLADGSLDSGCKRAFPTPLNSLYYFLGLSKLFPKSRRFGEYQQTFIDERAVVEVDCISGAFMLIKKEVFNLVGGFDEDYFLYCEDVDLCYKLKKAGFKNLYYGKVSFLHFKNESGKNSLRALENFYKSMQIFYDKHYKNKYPAIVRLMVKIGISLKLWIAKKRFKRVVMKHDRNITSSI